MNKVLKVLLVLVLLAIGYTAGQIYKTYSNMKPAVNTAQKYGSIIRLVEDGHTFCSGTVVASNLIVTAAHCVLMETPIGYMKRDNIEIRPSGNQNLGTTGTTIYATPQMDQALIYGNFKSYEVRRFISDPSALQPYRMKHTKFISCGFPLNGDLYCNETIMDSPNDFFWSVDGVLIPGMSGGPTMLPDGTVIGVNVAVSKDKSLISPIYNITKNLEKH